MKDLASPAGNGRHNNKPEIVATYNYVDEDGTLLYQAVRMVPKDFRQRRPKAGGGWTWSLKGVRRVPYRLPELINADLGEWIYIPEGERDVENLRRVDLVATCNAGGAGKWLPSFNERLRGRRVCILPDNDPPGRKHADQIAGGLQGIAAEVTVVDLPGLGEKQDVSDWLSNGGSVEELRRLVDQAPEWKPTTAAVETDPPPVWKPFPVEAIPEPVRSYVVESAAAIGCDPAFVATAIVPVLAGAIGNARHIILKSGWTEPAVLWGVDVGDSGSQKSPAIDAATRHVKRRQGAAIEVYRAEREEHDKAVELYRLSYEDWKRKGRNKGEPPPEEPIEPRLPRFYCSDTTIEALAVVLELNDRGVLLVRDELSGWVNSFGEYKRGPGSDVANWLNIHGARDLVVDRKTGDRKTIYVRRAAVSICGGIQPGTLRRVLGTEHFENGLAARLLLAMPPRRTKKWTEAGIDEALDRRVEAVFDRLYELEQEERDGQPAPLLVGLTREGKAVWIEFYNRHAERIADATGDEAALLSKIEAAAARIALVVHCVRQAAGDPDAGTAIDETSVRSGISIAEWYASEAERVYQVLRESDQHRERRELVDLIQRKGGTVSARDLMRSSRKYDTADEAEAVLQDLASAGLGSFELSQPGPDGGRPVRRFTLVDAVGVDRTTQNPKGKEVVSMSTLSTGPKSEVSSAPADEWEEFVL